MEYISKLVSIDAILNWYTQMLKRKSYRNFRSNHSVIKNWLKSHSELVIIYSPWFYYSKPGWCSFFTYHFMFLEFARPMLDCLFFWKLIFSFADDVFWFILGTGFHNKSANSTVYFSKAYLSMLIPQSYLANVWVLHTVILNVHPFQKDNKVLLVWKSFSLSIWNTVPMNCAGVNS